MLVSEVIDRVLDEYLYPAGESRPSYDTLAADLDASSTAISVAGRVSNIPGDTVLEIGSELILVNAVSGTDITAQTRGYLETVGAEHSAGDAVWIDPDFPRKAILSKVSAIVSMLKPWGLYARKTDTSQTFTTREVTTLPAGARRLINATVRDPGSYETYTELTRRGVDWIEHKAFTPPKVQFRPTRGVDEGASMTLVYEADFTKPTAESDDITTVCGVPDTLADALPMGVAGLLMQGREVTRIQVETIRRLLASQGVTVGSSMNVGQTLLGTFRTQYVMAERVRQSDLDPPTFEWVRS